MPDEMPVIVVMRVTPKDVELMHRYLLSHDNDTPDVPVRTDDKVVAEFTFNAVDNMLDNCHELAGAGELPDLPEATRGS